MSEINDRSHGDFSLNLHLKGFCSNRIADEALRLVTELLHSISYYCIDMTHTVSAAIWFPHRPVTDVREEGVGLLSGVMNPKVTMFT